MSKRKRRVFIVLLALFLLLGAAFVWRLTHQPAKSSKKAGKAAKGAVSVSVTEARRGSMVNYNEYSGEVSPFERIPVSSKISGKIQNIYVNTGDFVNAGDRLLAIETEEIEIRKEQSLAAIETAKASVKQAEVGLENAAREYERSKSLYEQKVITSQAWDGVQSKYQAAQAQKEMAESSLLQARAAMKTVQYQLDNALIVSPTSGRIESRQAEEGVIIGPGSPLLTVINVSRLKVSFEVSEKDIIRAKQGTPVLIAFDALGKNEVSASISMTAPSLNPVSKTMRCEVYINNPAGDIKPGMFARVKVVMESSYGRIIIPREAVIKSGSLTKVFTIENGRAIEHVIETGISDTARVSVLKGLQEKDKVVVSGKEYLENNFEVKVEE